MLLCEDNLVDWVDKQNGLMITRRKMNVSHFDFKLQRNTVYVCLTGYKQVIAQFFEKLLCNFVSSSRIIIIIVASIRVLNE